jgi:hypothetical protein
VESDQAVANAGSGPGGGIPQRTQPPAAPWSGLPFPYQPYAAAPLVPLAPFPTPSRPRTPRRYLVGAVAALTVGLALAATSVAASLTKSGTPVPPTAAELRDQAARAVWRDAPVDAILPPSIDIAGGEKYLRLGIAGPASCDVLPNAFQAELANVAPGTRCVQVLRATYTDSTQTVLATVGVIVIGGPPVARDKVWRQWTPDSDAKRADMMPSVYPVPGTVAAKFDDSQRIAWRSQTSDDGSYLCFTVSGFVDGRAGSTPDQLQHSAGKALAADSPPVQASVEVPLALVKTLRDAGDKA